MDLQGFIFFQLKSNFPSEHTKIFTVLNNLTQVVQHIHRALRHTLGNYHQREGEKARGDKMAKHARRGVRRIYAYYAEMIGHFNRRDPLQLSCLVSDVHSAWLCFSLLFFGLLQIYIYIYFFSLKKKKKLCLLNNEPVYCRLYLPRCCLFLLKYLTSTMWAGPSGYISISLSFICTASGSRADILGTFKWWFISLMQLVGSQKGFSIRYLRGLFAQWLVMIICRLRCEATAFGRRPWRSHSGTLWLGKLPVVIRSRFSGPPEGPC